MNYTAAYRALNDLLEMESSRLGDIWESARINGADTCIENGHGERQPEFAVRTFFDLLDEKGLRSEHDKYMAIAKATRHHQDIKDLIELGLDADRLAQHSPEEIQAALCAVQESGNDEAAIMELGDEGAAILYAESALGW